MRALVLATTVAMGIGLLGVSGASAAPANGIVIGQAASVEPLTQQVWYRWHYRWRHCWWRGGYRHCR
jgi:hypothetical protein